MSASDWLVTDAESGKTVMPLLRLRQTRVLAASDNGTNPIKSTFHGFHGAAAQRLAGLCEERDRIITEEYKAGRVLHNFGHWQRWEPLE